MEKEKQWVYKSTNTNEGMLMFYHAMCSYD
jgi:hypothetical protein